MVVALVRYLGGTARTIGGPGPVTSACLGLALLGLIVGVCLVVLPCAVSFRPALEVPGTAVDAAMRPLRGLSPQEVRQATVVGHQASSPHDGLAWGDGNLDDDAPWDRNALTTEGLVLPPTPFRRSTGLTSAYPRPSRYLVRPQLLTRL